MTCMNCGGSGFVLRMKLPEISCYIQVTPEIAAVETVKFRMPCNLCPAGVFMLENQIQNENYTELLGTVSRRYFTEEFF